MLAGRSLFVLGVLDPGRAAGESLEKSEVAPKDGSAPQVELCNPDEVGNLFASLDRSDREYGKAGQVLKRSGPDGVTTYRYDADGNLSERDDPDGGRWLYHWDDAGQLSQVDRPDGESVAFRYDAFGRRVEKNAGGVVTRWTWDGNVPLHEWRCEGEVPKPRRSKAVEGRKKALEGQKEKLGEEAWLGMLAEEGAEGNWLAVEVLKQALAEEPEAFGTFARRLAGMCLGTRLGS